MGSTQEASPQKTPQIQKFQQQQKTNPTVSSAAVLNQPIQTMAYLRIWQILGDKKANPPVVPLLPISRTSFYNGIKSKKYPAPVRLSARVSAWRVEDIRKLLESMGREKPE